MQIQKPKEVASELRRTSYKHTLWKLMYTIQDEHMLTSMDSKTLDKYTQPILWTHIWLTPDAKYFLAQMRLVNYGVYPRKQVL